MYGVGKYEIILSRAVVSATSHLRYKMSKDSFYTQHNKRIKKHGYNQEFSGQNLGGCAGRMDCRGIGEVIGKCFFFCLCDNSLKFCTFPYSLKFSTL